MNQFIVSARKYRPQRFDEVVGQNHIIITLKNAIRQNKVAHAFLFCGPRGVGKTTTARILAQTINCESITDDTEACGNCPSCEAFQKKNAPNIIELDAASHNSVDDIRNLNEHVRIPPAQGKYKLFIIDEVHMLSIAAFNAFLKTLEEPPPSAIFILATTEKHKILPTILSRCQIYDFKRNKVQDIIRHLENICEAESLKYDREALHLIAEKADGALRDALSIFDRMVSFSDGHITYEAVIDQLSVLDYDYFFKLTDHLITGDLSASYLLFDQILEKGFSPEVFLLGFQEHLRQLLMFRLSHTAGLVNGSSELQQRYANQSTHASQDFILTVLDLANECDVSYRFAQNKRLHVEIALMKMAYFPYAKLQLAPDTSSAEPGSQPGQQLKKNDNPDRPQLNREISDVPLSIPDKSAPTIPGKDTTETSGNQSIPKVTPESGSLQDVPDTSGETMHPGYPGDSNEKGDFSQENKPGPIPSNKSPKTRAEEELADYNPPKTKRKSKKLLPTLNAMDEILEEVEQNNADSQSLRDDEELFELIKATWSDYTENHSSPSMVTYLKDSKLSWKEGKLLVVVTSQLARSSILDQRSLFEELREATSPHTPEIVFEIDPGNTAAIKPQKILTTRDKYEALKKANPNLDVLIKELNLKIDQD